MPMAQYSVIKKEQIIVIQKILGRLQDIMQIEKKFKIPHIIGFNEQNSFKIIEIENDQFLPVYKHGKGCDGV